MMPALDRPAGVAAGLKTHGRLVGETSPTPSRGGQPAINTVSRRLKAPARWRKRFDPSQLWKLVIWLPSLATPPVAAVGSLVILSALDELGGRLWLARIRPTKVDQLWTCERAVVNTSLRSIIYYFFDYRAARPSLIHCRHSDTSECVRAVTSAATQSRVTEIHRTMSPSRRAIVTSERVNWRSGEFGMDFVKCWCPVKRSQALRRRNLTRNSRIDGAPKRTQAPERHLRSGAAAFHSRLRTSSYASENPGGLGAEPRNLLGHGTAEYGISKKMLTLAAPEGGPRRSKLRIFVRSFFVQPAHA